MGDELDDPNAVPISDAEAYRLQDYLSRVQRVEDMGIHPITRWRLVGYCSYWMHGQVNVFVETTEKIPSQEYITCVADHGDAVRRVKVRDRVQEA